VIIEKNGLHSKRKCVRLKLTFNCDFICVFYYVFNYECVPIRLSGTTFLISTLHLHNHTRLTLLVSEPLTTLTFGDVSTGIRSYIHWYKIIHLWPDETEVCISFSFLFPFPSSLYVIVFFIFSFIFYCFISFLFHFYIDIFFFAYFVLFISLK